MLTLLNPIWLLLALPLGALWWLWRAASPLVAGLRLAVLALLWLALCGLAWRLPSRAGTVVVVADRSLSMPAGNDGAQREAIELLQKAMSRDDRLAVVSFGEQAAVERPPQAGAFAGFTNQVAADASNLREALDKAVALIAPDAPGRVIILSDGRWTGADPTTVAARAAARGLAFDYRLSQRSTANDLAITQIDAPVSVTPGEAFMLTAWMQAPLAQEVGYELTRGGQVLAAGKTNATQGLNRLTFRDLAGAGGTQSYRLRIAGSVNPQADPQPENNTAKWLIGVRGPKPLLHVTDAANSALARLLKAGGLPIETRPARQCEWTLDALLERLSQVDLVLVEGFKTQAHPKLEVYRAAVGKALLHPEDENIVAIASDGPVTASVPVVALDDTEAVADILVAKAALLDTVIARVRST